MATEYMAAGPLVYYAQLYTPRLSLSLSLSVQFSSSLISSWDAVCLTWEGPTLNMAIMANSFRCFDRIWEDYTALWRANYVLH